MICPKCGTNNPDNARFCIECGQPLSLPVTCPVCGAVNPAGARFCNQCGSPLPGTQAQAAEGARPSVPVAQSAVSAPAASVAPAPTPAPPPASASGRTTRARPSGGSATAVSIRGARQPAAQATAQAAEAIAAPDTGETNDQREDVHDEERRVVSVLFADLTSSTALADGMDPEDVRALLGGFFATMAREIHRHGGTVEKYIGDAVMAVFGMPVAHEDDPLRAVRAALDMQVALRELNAERQSSDPVMPELQMRIGINTGEVVAASGAAEGRDFLITGDAVNVAARLQQVAAPDSILVGPRTYRSTSGAVEYRALPPVSLRGKPRPLGVWEALALVGSDSAPLPRPRGVAGMDVPFVGRGVELELLRSVYSRVADEHRPHLVTIVGVPGVGKTRLAREFVEATIGGAGTDGSRQPLVLEGRCPPYGEGVTYWPLAEMLRAFCGFSGLSAPEAARETLGECVRDVLFTASRREDPELIAAYLGQTIGIESRERRQALLPAESRQFQEGLLRAWRVFFEALAVQGPLIVLIDDIHWADDVLLDLIEYVAGRAAGVPLLLLCPARPELLEKRPDWGGGKRNYVTLGLEPLSPRDAERLVRELLPGEDVPESLRQGILQKAEGNPFYVEEIVRMLIDRGILLRDPMGAVHVALEWEGSEELRDPAIPDTVQGVLAARLDLLSQPERDVLQHAAVIGRYFWPEALRHLHAESNGQDLDAVVASLMAKDLIRETERPQTLTTPAGEPIYTFNHALTREVTYAGIPRTRRAHEHQHVAEWLEEIARGREGEFAEMLAQHYRQFYIQANLPRARNGARRQAVRSKVIGYLTLAGDQSMARHAAIKAEQYYSDALDLLAEDARAEDVPQRVELHTRRGDAHWLQVVGDAAWTDYREALRLWSAYSAFMVDSAGERSAGERSAGAGAGTGAGGEHDEGTIVAPVAVDGALAAMTEMAEAAETAEPQEGGVSLPLDWRSRGMRLYRLLVLLPARYPSAFQQPPAHRELLGYLQEGLRLSAELGQSDTLEAAELLTAKAFFWWSWPQQRGERELLDALRSAQEAVRITEALDDPQGASEALDALGSMQAITTDLRGNLESQTQRLQWARRIDNTHELVDVHASVCNAYTLVGDYALAVEQGRLALDLAETAEADPLRASVLRHLVIAYFEWDRWPQAVQAAEQLQTVSARLGVVQTDQQRWALLAWAIALARTGERDASDAVARRVSDPPDRNEVQFVELYEGRLALARGAMKEARQLLLGALEAHAGRQILPALLAELAELGARTGDRELYERFAAQAQEIGWRSGARKALSQALRARGIVAIADSAWDDGLADLHNALVRYQELGTRWEEARTRYALAGLYRRRGAPGDETLAREELAQAQTLFESLHAIRDTARARAALAGGDVRIP